MKYGALLVIAAMVVAPIAAVISIPAVGAAHTASVSVDRAKVKGGWSGVLTLTVANTTGDAINVVQLYTVPTGWDNFRPIKEVPKDNLVILVENIVVLPAGTALEVVLAGDSIILPENSRVLVPDENQFRYPVGGTLFTLANDNLEVEVTAETKIVGVTDDENMKVAKKDGLLFELSANSRVKLLKNTPVIHVGGNIVKLPENTLVQTVAENENQIEEHAELYFKDYYLVTLPAGAANVKCVESSVSASPSLLGTDMKDKIVELVQGKVYIPPTTVVKIEGQPLARLSKYENENVLLTADTQLDVSEATVENRPKNWMQDAANQIWTGIGDNKIVAEDSENFPFAISAPSAGGKYTFWVRTTDQAGSVKDWAFTIEVDNAIEVKVDADKKWVGGGDNITITVTSEEPFTFDNIVVYENNAADENKRVYTMDNATPNADNTQWTIVFTTRENEDWENADGYLTIEVNNAKDEVGNSTSVTKGDLVFVDRRAPPAPNLSALGMPTGVENKATWPLSITLSDVHDNLIFTPSGYSPENLLLEVLVDNQVVQSGVASPTGLVSLTLSLSEGKHTIGARIVDKVGNRGKESFDNVIIDITAPSVSISVKNKTAGTPVSDGGYAIENRLIITVTFSDSVLGIENVTGLGIYESFRENENWDRGWVVFMYDKDNLAENWFPTPKAYPVEENEDNVVPNVFLSYTFENETLELPSGTYVIVAYTGDSIRTRDNKGAHRDNKQFEFTIDVTPPEPPVLSAASRAYQVYSHPGNPYISRTASYYMDGTVEAGATVTIYIIDAMTGETLETVPVDVERTGAWSKAIDIKEYQGRKVKVEIEATDAAGNKSVSRSLYGYFLYDASPPTVAIDAQYKNITTDQTSIVISGKVTIDAWESYVDISLAVSPTTASLVFNRATGEFSIGIPQLGEGQNLVSVAAYDKVGNSDSDSAVITRTVTPWATYAIIVVIIALILAAIAIFRKR